MNRRYMDLYDEQVMVSRVWRLGCACLAVALAIACLQWGRAWARAVRAEGSVERSMLLRLELGRGPAFAGGAE